MLLESTGNPSTDSGRQTVNVRFRYSPDACIMCWKKPHHKGHRFCGLTCAKAAYRYGPLFVIPHDHEAFTQIRKKFCADWDASGKKSKPWVHRVYKIIMPKSVEDAFDAYRTQTGKVRRLWHGTSHEGVVQTSNQLPTVCNSGTCGLCGIIRGSFSMSKCSANYVGRFGRGIYTSRFSSTADRYSIPSQGDNWKALLLNQVACGLSFSISSSDPGASTLTKPPPGFHSVVSHDVPHNGNECIVYNDCAILPSWLVLYEP